MKKLLIIPVLLLAFTITAFSQDNPKFVYAEIVRNGRLFGNKINIVLDFGQQMKIFDNRLRDTSGKPREFNTMIDALNFMAKQDWEFIQAYTVFYSSENNEIHYVIKKKFEDLSEEERGTFLKDYR